MVELSLVDDEETRKQWDYKFELVYQIILKKGSLTTDLKVYNTGQSFRNNLFFCIIFFYNWISYLGSKQFDFTTLLHTYFQVDNIYNVKVKDLNGFEFVDKVFILII